MTQGHWLRDFTGRAMMTSMLMTASKDREHRSSSKWAQLRKLFCLLQLCRNTFLPQSSKETKNEVILYNTALCPKRRNISYERFWMWNSSLAFLMSLRSECVWTAFVTSSGHTRRFIAVSLIKVMYIPMRYCKTYNTGFKPWISCNKRVQKPPFPCPCCTIKNTASIKNGHSKEKVLIPALRKTKF